MIKEIVNCDALTYIKTLNNDTIDLIILDPNYQDWKKLIKDGFIDECMRVLKESGNLLCFTKQPFDLELRNALVPFFRREIIWTFTNGGAWVSNKMPLVSFQKIYWCVKSKNFYFNARTGQEYSSKTKDFKRASKMFGDWIEEGRKFEKSEDGTWLRDHLHFNKPQTANIPAKPSELIKILVNCFCEPNGLVYDAFSGTGTIVKIADALDREVIATEIDAERCDKIIDYFMEKADEQVNNEQC